ncbi:MAG: energy transducer TonB [Candidatus Andeanibacterium colombiense]|uniref:Energy transducer TonB n=1 Tax=Candidatus Andeanibacterium colombiense TaxID=3121345 RepID=A0AAJ5X396_9SPHN|nr:MAG: energy transducer TonB [Sphingomonadaceae bacterium]
MPEIRPASRLSDAERQAETFEMPVLTNPKRLPWAMAASLGLHGLIAGALLVNWSFGHHDEAPPPAAMVVELSVMPASPPVPTSEIPPGPQQVEAAPKPKPLDRMKFDPPPQVDSSLKPDFALPVKQEIKPQDSQVVAKEARQTTAPQSVPAPPKDKSEAPVEGSNAAPPSDAAQAWEGQLLARLERNKRYPAQAQSAGQQGVVYLRLVMDRKGRMISSSIKTGSGFSVLDSETLALAKRASPYPVPPASVVGDQIVRVVPIQYFVKKRR